MGDNVPAPVPVPVPLLQPVGADAVLRQVPVVLPLPAPLAPSGLAAAAAVLLLLLRLRVIDLVELLLKLAQLFLDRGERNVETTGRSLLRLPA